MSSYSDYSVRRSYAGRPGLTSSYTYTTPSSISRQYIGTDSPGVSRQESSSYSKTYSSTSSSGGPGGLKSESHTSESRSSSGGYPGSGYSYKTESSRSSDGRPGSHFSSVSYRSPYGNNYRSFSSR